MPLNQKHFKLVQILLKSNLPIDKAALELDISEKTITNYIKQINREFADIFSIRKRDSLLVLTIMDDQKFWDELNKGS
ncbi:HTH domain-containing protein, partial [Staphylococcus condimenti]